MQSGLRSWIRSDGLLHIETSALITIAIALLLPWWASASIAFAIGIAKELWDKEHGGVASWHDVICDIAGIALGAVIAVL